MEEVLNAAPEISNTNTEVSQEFYVVSPLKFVILFIGTLGFYSIYWFYKHWSLFKKHNNDNIWPIPRAIFAIFFTHALFGVIDDKYQQGNHPARKSLSFAATVFVVLTILGRLLDKLASNEIVAPLLAYSSLAFIPIICWALLQGQLKANIACNDPAANSNRTLTVFNCLWLFLGALLWFLVIFGLLITLNIISAQ
ncbi:hypothetical protein DU002_00785 [Corallincola holothuriorum]|uniref:DUF4234 domain-containing protein n=1 Tax=Corallincola holothuriorum TaxID=2282215 RepID=A0A368NQ59_9GAMM|nr:DUF4234 domain-containing protein [Corallincola holothuriorum]RCU52538.1 hypothetical protein DU002_00785 [Corallincola holothuriorum]